jgi:hypothetical protein
MRNENVSFAIASSSTKKTGPAQTGPDEMEELWRLWVALPWKRAQYPVENDMVDVVFHGSTWWSNGHGESKTNDGVQNSEHGFGYGADLIRTADYVPLINVGPVTTGTWLGRATLDARVSVRDMDNFERFPLHGLIIGDADEVRLSADEERGVLLRSEALLHGTSYRIVEMTEVNFDEDMPAETFTIEPTTGEWTVVDSERMAQQLREIRRPMARRRFPFSRG